MKNLPFLVPLAALVGGILLAEYTAASLVTASLLSAFSVYLFIAMGRARRHGPIADMRAQKLLEPAVLSLFMAAGLVSAILARPTAPDADDPDLPRFADVRITRVRQMTYGDVADAQLLGFCENASDSVLSFKPKGCKVRLTIKDLMLQPGDMVRFPHEFSDISANRNYFHDDFRKQVRRKGFFFSQTLAKGEAQLIGVDHTLATRAADARDNMSQKLENSSLSHRTSSLLRTILLGDSDAVSADDREQFAAAGLAHMLSLSGMHIGLVAALVLFLLLPLNLTRRRKLRFLVAAIAVWIYVILTGLHLSAIRAAIMLTLYILSLSLERNSEPLNALLAAAFIILIIDPSALFDCGFQLSCLCVFALAGFTRFFAVDSLAGNRALHTFLTTIITTILATLASWAVVACHFSRLPLLFLPANVIVAPLIPIAMGSGALILVMEYVGYNSHLFSDFVNRLVDFIYRISDSLSDEAYSITDINVSPLTAISWVVFVVLLYFTICNFRDKRKFRIMIPTTAVIFFGTVVSLIFTNNDVNNNGLIVHDNYREVAFTVLEDSKENVIRMNAVLPIDTIINGKTVVYINDRRYYKNSRTRRPVPEQPGQTEILIVGNRFYGSMDDILQYYRPEMIVGHKSLTADTDITLQCAAKRLDVPYHSIREQGPYRMEW